MKNHYVDVSLPSQYGDVFDVGICGFTFGNYHQARGAPLPGQLRRFFDCNADQVDCKTCIKQLAKRLALR